MKKYILALIVVILLSIGGYVAYQNYFITTEYSVKFDTVGTTKQDIDSLKKYGKIGEIGRISFTLYITGSAEKKKEIIKEIRQKKFIYSVYETRPNEPNVTPPFYGPK